MFLIIVGIVIITAITGWSLTGFFIKPSNYDNFAKCLKQKGATMYGAEWCGHCKEQKEAFGESFKYVNYIECPNNQALCEQMGIEGYPTWIINGIHYAGTQSLETLSSLTDCNLK